jgi:Cu(I)/Ag(I) efflux system membrane fusion protein
MSPTVFSNVTDSGAVEPLHPETPPLTRWQKLRLIVKVVEIRLRFIALLAITGLAFAYWETIWNRYEKWMRPQAQRYIVASGIEFYCPMHPHVIQDQPGACPICGMPLARRKKGENKALPEGVTARLELAPLRVAQAGIKTAAVAYAPLAQTLTTVGEVAYDERRMATIVSRIPGKSRVETLHVNFTGQNVEAGQPLAELYSPELNQAIQELLTASRRADSTIEPQTEVARSLVRDWREMARASAEKLKRWGITQAQIDEILAHGRTDFRFTIVAPFGGHVLKKNVMQGQEVPEGYPMFEVVDLGTVWVQARVYEHQLGSVHEGQAVEATVPAFPGETFSGKVEFVQPHLDPATRTVEVRYGLANTGHRLKPGLFATVTLKTPIAETPPFRARIAASRRALGAGRPVRLTAEQQKTCPVTRAKLGSMGAPIPVEVEGTTIWTCCNDCPPKLKAQLALYRARLAPPPEDQVLFVPESAVIDTGTHKVVYVESQPGVFEGRQVLLGPRVGDRFPVIDGLAAGEQVAAAGAFLIDAESRINPGAALAAAGGSTRVADVPGGAEIAAKQGTHAH